MKLTEQQQKYFDQLMALADLGKTVEESIVDIVTGIESEKLVPAVTEAIRQLEEQQAKDAENLKSALAKARRMAYDPNGHYKGVFANEEQARAFGLQAMFACQKDQRLYEALKGEFPDVAKAMDTVNDPSIVFPEFSTRMQSLFESYGVFERNAMPMPMSSDQLTFLKETGEVTVFLVGEGNAPTASDIDTGAIALNAKKWGGLNYYSAELGEDAAIAVGELLARSIARAMAKKMDNVGFNGDGSATYFGINGVIPRLKAVNGVDDGGGLVLGSGNLWSELALVDFEGVMGALPQYAADQANWYCSRAFFFNVMVKLMLAAGGVTAAEIEGRRRLQFGGDPVEISQVLPAAQGNSQVPVIYGDLMSAATVGNRRQLSIKQSDQYKFAEGQITTLATRRVAVNVHDVGTDTEAGPVVGLITQSS
jgi:HK97 family phage major capsid protein